MKSEKIISEQKNIDDDHNKDFICYDDGSYNNFYYWRNLEKYNLKVITLEEFKAIAEKFTKEHPDKFI